MNSSGAIPAGTRVIEVRVTELRQFFNAIDPSPFHERDLDPKAAEFIVESARELPARSPLALHLRVDGLEPSPEDEARLREAVAQYFGREVARGRRELRELFARGRLSLLIGIGFLALMMLAGRVLEGAMAGRPLSGLAREGLLIAGWVAMWRPLEIFLYDWWPIRATNRLFERLCAMPVEVSRRSQPTRG